MADPQDPNHPGPPPRRPDPLGGDGGGKNLIPINIEDEMRRSYLDYAMSVIVGRALPDVRDGLKPVHRRILYGMHELGLALQSPHPQVRQDRRRRAWANTIRTATCRSTTRWSAWRSRFRCAIRWWTGREISVPSTAIRPRRMRYTEARLSRIAATMLEDIDKETVDFRPNYDESEVEPEVLPARIPNLLINGSEGIAVGMASKIPPHNLTRNRRGVHRAGAESGDHAGQDRGDRAGPGFPHRRDDSGPRRASTNTSRTAAARIKVRAKAATEKLGKDREAIVVTEIPYQVNKARLMRTSAELVNEKKLEGISEIRDESDRDGMRIVFELKRGEQAEVVLNNLYKQTQMQISFGVILLAIVNGQPREMGIARRAEALHRSSRRCGPPPHGLSAAQGSRARASFCSGSRRRSTIWTR